MGSRTVIPPPPPGFVLDSGSIPPPPPGFVLDTAPSEAATTRPSSGAWSWESYAAPTRGIGKGLYNTFAGATQAAAPFAAKVGLGSQFPPLRSAQVDPGEEFGNTIGQILPYLTPGGPMRGVGGAAIQGLKAAGVATAQGEDPLLAGGLAAASVGTAPLLNKLLAPLSKSVDRGVTAAATRQGVEMPASALSTSKLVPLAEGIAAKGIGGRGVTQRFTAAQESLTKIADETARTATSLQDGSAVGHSIAAGLDKFRATWTKTKNALYDAAELPKKGLTLQARETVGLLDSIIEGKRSAGGILKEGPVADAAFYRGLRDGLTRMVTQNGKKVRVLKDVEARDLLNANRELTQKINASFADPFSAANKGALKKVSATMDRELTAALGEKAPDLAAKLAQADTVYAEGIAKINSAFGKNIHRLARSGQYDKIAQAVANSRMAVDDIPKIMEVAGKEGAEGMRSVVIVDLVSKAKGPTGSLTPTALSRAIKNFGEDRLRALLTSEQYAKLSDVATLSTSLQKGQKVAEGSQTAFLVRMGGLPAGFIADPASAFLYLVGDSAFSRFVASKTGQRWLTSGFRPLAPTIGRGVNVLGQGSRVAATGSNQE